MTSHVDEMKKALILACQAAQVCKPGEIAFDRDISAFRIGRHGFQVQYDATSSSGPVWKVQEIYEAPDLRNGGFDAKLRNIATGGTRDYATVAKVLAMEIVGKEIDHILDARLN